MGGSDPAGQRGLTLSLCMIVKNCEDHLAKTLLSVPMDCFDEVVILDTGSTDRTVDIAKQFATVFKKYCDPDPVTVRGKEYISDFAAARNAAYELCTKDFIFWLDSDDLVSDQNAMREFIKTTLASNLYDAFSMDYDYSHDEQGNCTLRHPRERFTRNKMFVWKSPIHEVLCATSQHNGRHIPKEMFKVVHDYHGPEDFRLKAERNLVICAKFIEKQGGEVEPRMWMNYGQSLGCLQRYQDCIEPYKKYLAGSLWNSEKYYANMAIGNCHRNLDDIEESSRWFMTAVLLMPELTEAYSEVATNELLLNNYEAAVLWADRALDSGKDNLHYRGNPYFNRAKPHQVKLAAFTHLFRFEEAIKEADLLIDVFPGDYEILSQKALCKTLMEEHKITEHYKALERHLHLEGDKDKLDSIRKAIPRSIAGRPDVDVQTGIDREGKPSVCIYCGDSMRTWDSSSIGKGGVGGSETAVIHMSRELTALGWHVEVYGLPSEGQEGLRNGAYWLPFWRIKNANRFDVLVNWRSPYPPIPPEMYSKAYIWLHDIQAEENWPRGVLDNLEKVMVLSEAHRKNVSWVPEEKIMRSANGLDPSWWEGVELTNNPHKLIYASCPSRGLEHVLDFWPHIRETFGDAELNIYYGFNENFKSQMKVSKVFADLYAKIIKGVNQPGISFHGMVDQKTLAQAFASSGIWAYPTSFPEISCITAMQAQAMGSVPICTRFWALDETVHFGQVCGDDSLHSLDEDDELKKQWLELLLEEMAETSEFKNEMIEFARKTFLWSGVAKQWDTQFRADLNLSENLGLQKTISETSLEPSVTK